MSDTQNHTTSNDNIPSTGANSFGAASPAALQGKIDTLKRLQGSARFQMVLTAVIAVGMFAGFTAGTYTAIQGNFNDKAVTAALERHAPAVLPEVKRELQRIVTAVSPTYRKVIAERYPQARKEIADKVLTRLYEIPEESGKQMLARLQNSFDRVLIRIQPELTAAFPNLSSEQRRELIVTYFHDAIAQRNEAVASHVEKTLVNELARTHQTLEKFALPIDASLTSDEQLQRQLSRTIMLLVDQALNDYQTDTSVAGTDGGEGPDFLDRIIAPVITNNAGPTTAPSATPTASTIEPDGGK